LVNLAHATHADQGGNLIRAEARAWSEAQLRGLYEA
jgi:hypothetical protein